MSRYFVDAFYWIALFSPRDQWHRRVLAFDATLGDAPLYTTDEVLTEFLNALASARPAGRAYAAATVHDIRTDPNESMNLAGAQPDLAQRLPRMVIEWDRAIHPLKMVAP